MLAALSQGSYYCIAFFILGQQFISFAFADLANHFCQVADTMRIHRIAEFYLSFHFIAIRNCYKAHVIPKTDKTRPLPIVPASGYTAPFAYFIHNITVFPMAYNNLAVQPHARHD